MPGRCHRGSGVELLGHGDEREGLSIEQHASLLGITPEHLRRYKDYLKQFPGEYGVEMSWQTQCRGASQKLINEISLPHCIHAPSRSPSSVKDNERTSPVIGRSNKRSPVSRWARLYVTFLPRRRAAPIKCDTSAATSGSARLIGLAGSETNRSVCTRRYAIHQRRASLISRSSYAPWPRIL